MFFSMEDKSKDREDKSKKIPAFTCWSSAFANGYIEINKKKTTNKVLHTLHISTGRTLFVWKNIFIFCFSEILKIDVWGKHGFLAKPEDWAS